MRMQHINRHSSWKWPVRHRAVRRFSFRRRLALWFGLVMLLSTCLAIALSYRVAEQVAISQFSEKLMAMASSGALGIAISFSLNWLIATCSATR